MSRRSRSRPRPAHGGRIETRKRAVAVLCLALSLALAPNAEARVGEPAVSFEVAGGPLADMLLDIARAAGAIVSFDPDLVKGLVGRPVRGAMSVREAFQQALAGSRLRPLVGDAGVWSVRPLSVAETPWEALPRVLGEVRVVAQADLDADGFALPGTVTPHPATPAEIPRSVSAVGSDLIERQAALELPDALQNVAGVSPVYDGTHSYVTSLRIRGTAVHGQIVDGMYGADGVAAPLEGIEQIDVVKGAADTTPAQLAGSSAVNLVTKKPRFEASSRLALRLSDDGARRAAVDLGASLDEARHWAYRVNLVGQRSVFAHQYDAALQEAYIAPAVRHRDGGDDFVAGFEYYRRKPAITRFTVALDRRPATLELPLWELFDETRTETSTRGYLLSDRAVGGGWRWASRASVSTRRSSYRVSVPETLADEAIVVFSRPLSTHGRSATLANELRRAFEIGPVRSRIALGIDWTSTRTDQCQCGVENVGLIDPRTWQKTFFPGSVDADEGSFRMRSTSFYLQDHVSIADRLHILASLRRSMTHLKSAATMGVFEFGEEKRDSFLTRSLGVSYELMPRLALFANWTEGANVMPAGLTASGQGLLPENIRQREAGLKLAGPDQRWQANIAAFRTDSDFVNAPAPLLPGFFIVLPGQSIRGFEAELIGSLGRGWEIAANYTRLDARAPDEFSVVPAQPERFGRLWTRYAFQDGALRGWGASFGVTGMSGSYADISGDDWVPGHVRLDAGVSYTASDWSADLTVNNLADRRIYGPSISPLRIPMLPSRTVTLALRFDL